MSAAAQPARVPIEPSVHAEASSARLRPILLRALKISASAVLLLAGAYGVFNEQHFVSTGDAVVSAYLASVRTPIDGTLNNVSAAPGSKVSEGAVLGSVENPRTDPQHLETLHDTEESARNGVEVLTGQIAALQAQKRELLERARIYMAGVTGRLGAQTMEAERVLASKRAGLDQAAANLRRTRMLYDSGIVSTAELDRFATEFDTAVHEESAQRAHLAALRMEADAAAHGVLIEPGINDVIYSRQRADEIELHLQDARRALAEAESQSRQNQSDLAQETRHSDLLHHANLVAPIPGVIWKIEAVNGEHVAAGDSLAEIVDCSQQFLLVDVPQDRVPDLAFGQVTKFRLSGESVERFGRLLPLVENANEPIDRKLAALPDSYTAGAQTSVRLSLAPGASQTCEIGRTARVLLPTTGRSWFARWYRKYF